MSSSEDYSDSESFTTSSDHKKETKRKVNNNINGEKKNYRQKFVDRWLDRFQPWLAKDESNPEKSYCKACKRFLSTKCCHLKRHERTSKHKINLQSYLCANGLLRHKQNLGQRKERKNSNKVSTNVDQSQFERIFMDTGTQETLKAEETFQIENVKQASFSYPKDLYARKQKKRKVKDHKAGTRKCGNNLFFQIQKDKHDLMSSFNELMAIEKKEKNSVDLFFEGVISSVKELSPKLIVETKMRIWQLIHEMEMRSICENESKSQTPSISLSDKMIIQSLVDTTSEVNQEGSIQNDL